MPRKRGRSEFLLCIRNEAYPASLEARKVYRSLSDPAAASRGFVRVIEESREDYLYPEDLFVPIVLPEAAKEAIMPQASG